jgi:hypothetical protein
MQRMAWSLLKPIARLTRNFSIGISIGGKRLMRMKKRINTTLGELIAAVTDEVMPIAGSQANADALVSYILNDLLLARKVKLTNRASLRSA